MNQTDLKQVKGLMEENNKSLSEVFKELLKENNQILMLEFGQFVEENINPQFGELGLRIDKLDQRVAGHDKRFDKLNQRVYGIGGKLANLPTKEYIDDKFADQLSNFQAELWRHNQSLVDILRDKQIIGLPDIEHLKKFRFIQPRDH